MVYASPELPDLKIVVVEDDASTRLMLRSLLEKLGHHVVGEADSGTAMVRTVLTMEPDLVIFDIHLPHLDGLAALSQIYHERVVAAVAISADEDVVLLRRAMEEHVLAYLIKPIDPPQLGPAVQVAWARFQELRGMSTEIDKLRQTLAERKRIEQAKGLLMKRHRWSEAEAFRRLQRAAMNHRTTMAEIAGHVIEGKEGEL